MQNAGHGRITTCRDPEECTRPAQRGCAGLETAKLIHPSGCDFNPSKLSSKETKEGEWLGWMHFLCRSTFNMQPKL
jgi:hypothetical protein